MTILFEDNFERNFAPWDGLDLHVGAVMDIQTTNPHHGSYVARSAITGVGSQTAMALINHLSNPINIEYARAYIIFNNVTIGVFGYQTWLGIHNNGDNQIFAMLADTGGGGVPPDAPIWGINVIEGGVSTFYNGTHSPTVGTRYCVELMRDKTNGVVSLWINDVLEVTQAVSLALPSLGGGVGYNTAIANSEMLIDCFVLADAKIGMEPANAPLVYPVTSVEQEATVGSGAAESGTRVRTVRHLSYLYPWSAP